MNFIRKSILPILLIASIAFAGYVYINKKAPCEAPIRYSLGSFDSRFKISKADFLEAAADATYIWENAYGKDLFEYADYKAPTRFETYFTRTPILISLKYDSRQQVSDQNQGLKTEINETKDDIATAKQELKDLQNKYDTNREQYLSLVAQYKNRQVDYATVEAKRQEVNGLSSDINALVKKHNSLVTYVNSKVDVINQNAGQEFEEGEYKSDQSGEQISIYEFTTHDALVRVLAHEFGHSLGLDHNGNPDSIMYYLNSSKNMTPTKDDMAALRAVCMKK